MVVYGDDKKASQGRPEGPSFGEIVGQEGFKQALLVAAANDAVDGLLVRGEKGTAKSTAVRALADLLPAQRAVADCPYGCHPDDSDCQCSGCRDRDDPPVTERSVPLVTLPLGATRDRVVGTLSVSDALDGEPSFEPGLLARANRGILYVDEVNLLDDHLVDVLLDAAASGVNRVERDGVSVSHPAEFTLVGTMNPEEGDLRPQLRDRFALQATVTGCTDLEDRVAIIEQAVGDGQGADDSGGDPRRRLRAALDRLGDVTLPGELAADIAELCRDAGVDGHRGDIATARAARTLAALDGRGTVSETDVRRGAELALPHRLKTRPFEDAPNAEEVIDEHFDDGGADDAETGTADGSDARDDDGSAEVESDASGPEDRDKGGTEQDETGAGEPGEEGDDGGQSDGDGSPDGGEGSDDREGDGAPGSAGSGDAGADESARGGQDGASAGGDPSDDSEGEDPEEATPLVPGQERAGVGDAGAPDLSTAEFHGGDGGNGSRVSADPSVDNEGPRVRTKRAEEGRRVDPAASVRATARRGGDAVRRRDLRQSVRAGEAGALVLFVVDASASMRPAMRTAKGTVLELLKDAYRNRDEVGFVAVAGDSADVVLPPTDSVSHAARHLKDLPTGDRTPLPDGLRTARAVIDRADPAVTLVVLVTDGRANVADGSPTDRTREAARALATTDARVLVVDAGGDDRAGVTDVVLDATDGERVPLSALSAGRVDEAVGVTQTQL